MLRSQRLVLQPWSVADLDDAVRLWTHPEVMRLLGGPMSRDKIEARLAHEMNNHEQLGFQYWRVTHEGSFVGCCGLKQTALGDEHVIELGFHLLPDAWGRGFATEAARTALDFAYARHEEVYSGHHPENAASRNVLRKLGFAQIGELFYPPTGLMHPWYRRLKAE